MNHISDLPSGLFTGPSTLTAHRTVGDLMDYWADPSPAREIAETPLYTTHAYQPQTEGPGVLYWGSTILHPGAVGTEFFMTRGHLHLNPTHGELIVVTAGTGLLALLTPYGDTQLIPLAPGVTHWITGDLAHRTINTGPTDLIFWCAWPSDCGHNYDPSLLAPMQRIFTQ